VNIIEKIKHALGIELPEKGRHWVPVAAAPGHFLLVDLYSPPLRIPVLAWTISNNGLA